MSLRNRGANHDRLDSHQQARWIHNGWKVKSDEARNIHSDRSINEQDVDEWKYRECYVIACVVPLWLILKDDISIMTSSAIRFFVDWMGFGRMRVDHKAQSVEIVPDELISRTWIAFMITAT